jgi:hypothetical protein
VIRLTRLILPTVLWLCLGGPALAEPPAASSAWAQLSAEQKVALAPLQAEWHSLSPGRRTKWLNVAATYKSLSPEDRVRLQARMAEWAALTPADRRRARLQYQEARRLPTTELYAQWQAYQSLPESDRRALAQSARPPSGAAVKPATAVGTEAAGKRNVLQPGLLPPSRAVAPAAQQARPGATTTAITARGLPPAHNQAGMPKISATPGFVDPATLLPQRGPQGAAARPPRGNALAASAASASAASAAGAGKAPASRP